ncbi:unnamed protein product [Amoebophrya sp. A25]|nr:unnamed protein product [Amoebophrya sp. A25]|eukprot:GSA25T00005665001.1
MLPTSENVGILHGFVQQFSRCWRFYFFIVEFPLVIGSIKQLFGIYYEAQSLWYLVRGDPVGSVENGAMLRSSEYVQELLSRSTTTTTGSSFVASEDQGRFMLLASLKLLLVFSGCALCTHLWIQLFAAAADISEACSRVRAECLQVSLKLVRVGSRDESERANRLYETALRLNTAVSAYGWVIDFHLAMSIFYPAATIITALLPLFFTGFGV